MEKVNPLGEEKILNLLVKFSAPAIVGMLVNSLYNIVDKIYIGNSPDLGSSGLAGISIAFPIMNLLMAIAVLFGIGGATLFSIRLGEKRNECAKEALGQTFSLLLFVGLLFMLLGHFFLEPVLILFGASETILPYSMEYLRVIFYGAIFQILGLGMNNFIRADGSPQIAMWTMFLGFGTNIILDPIFIYGFKMGMAGAAWATIIAQCISAIWVVAYFLGKRSKIKFSMGYLKLDPRVAVTIMTLGLPGFFLQLANSILNVTLNKNLLVYGGDLAVSTMGAVYGIQTMFFMPVIGIRQGLLPIMSYNYGAQKYERIKEAAKLASIAATAFVAVGFLLTILFPGQIIALFNREPELLAMGSKALPIWFLCSFTVGFQIIATSLFQAIGKSGVATFLTLSRQIILLIPAIIIFPMFWGYTGILYAAPFSDLFSSLLTLIYFYYGIKNLGVENFQHGTDKVLTENLME